jgi:hypothetical protein
MVGDCTQKISGDEDAPPGSIAEQDRDGDLQADDTDHEPGGRGDGPKQLPDLRVRSEKSFGPLKMRFSVGDDVEGEMFGRAHGADPFGKRETSQVRT